MMVTIDVATTREDWGDRVGWQSRSHVLCEEGRGEYQPCQIAESQTNTT